MIPVKRAIKKYDAIFLFTVTSMLFGFFSASPAISAAFRIGNFVETIAIPADRVN